ncbi:unnamed protein product [Cylicocyclus nassatus]|uniref:Uncharacterized protein n=1 Tax=Cylicocyclus nassatus TaxID=53992 RepID=A0AA36MBW1_CYLNA|nr:unnamed protein product [Cylicocyclus nassatus]
MEINTLSVENDYCKFIAFGSASPLLGYVGRRNYYDPLPKEQIRVSGISPNQLLEAVDNLKRDFVRNQMENHWLLPSLSPLLALTAQELEKSRETSSIGENSQTERKESAASVFSLKVTGDDLQHAARYNADNMEENSVQMRGYETRHPQEEHTNAASNSSHLSDSPDDARANTHSSTEAVELDNSRDEEMKEECAEAITILNEMQREPDVESVAQKIPETGIEENHTEKSALELQDERRVDDRVEKMFLLSTSESPAIGDGCDVPKILGEGNGAETSPEQEADGNLNESEDQENPRNVENTPRGSEQSSGTTEQADQAERGTQIQVPTLNIESDADKQTQNDLQEEDKDVFDIVKESLLEENKNSNVCSQEDLEHPYEIESDEYTSKESVGEFMDGTVALRKLSNLTERSEDSGEDTDSLESKILEVPAITANISVIGDVKDVEGMEDEDEQVEIPKSARDVEGAANVQVLDEVTIPLPSQDKILHNEVSDKIENEAQDEVTNAAVSHVDADVLDNDAIVDNGQSTALEIENEEAPAHRIVEKFDTNEVDANIANGAEEKPLEKVEQLLEEQSLQDRNSEIEETNTSASLNDNYSARAKIEEVRSELSCEEVEEQSISEIDNVSNKQEEEKNAKDSCLLAAENVGSESNDNGEASAENQQSAYEYNEDGVTNTRVDKNSVGAGTVQNSDRGFDENDSILSSIDLRDELGEGNNVEDQDTAQTITTGSTFDEIDIGRQSSLASVLKDVEARLVRFPSEISHAEVSTLRKEKEFDEAPIRSHSLSPQLSETLSTLGVIALPEFELTHKYHIQSHINTASRIPVTIQPVNDKLVAYF